MTHTSVSSATLTPTGSLARAWRLKESLIYIFFQISTWGMQPLVPTLGSLAVALVAPSEASLLKTKCMTCKL